MANLYTHQASNVRKTWLLLGVFISLFIGLGYVISALFVEGPAGYFVFGFAVFLSLFMSFGSYWWSDKIVLKMSHAIPATKEEHRELYNITENLAITAGLPMPKLYIVDSPAPNAFATGRNPEHGVVAVTTGLLALLDKTELEGVIAHELAHIGNRDILIGAVTVVIVGTIVYIADMMFHTLLFGGGRDKHPAQIALGVVAILVILVFANIIKMAISRRREFLADASGAMLTRYPEGLASALQKISQDNHQLKTANHATAHLFFENPFKGDKKGKKASFVTRLFMTHPPVEDRVEALLSYNQSQAQ